MVLLIVLNPTEILALTYQTQIQVRFQPEIIPIRLLEQLTYKSFRNLFIFFHWKTMVTLLPKFQR
jgi:hypothetical protein